jgi:hypothetical protein
MGLLYYFEFDIIFVRWWFIIIIIIIIVLGRFCN